MSKTTKKDVTEEVKEGVQKPVKKPVKEAVKKEEETTKAPSAKVEAVKIPQSYKDNAKRAGVTLEAYVKSRIVYLQRVSGGNEEAEEKYAEELKSLDAILKSLQK